MLLERQVSGMIFAGGQYAEADAPHEHYQRLLRAAPAGRARQRRRRAPRLPARLDRRRGRDGAGLRAPRLPRPRADRARSRARRTTCRRRASSRRSSARLGRAATRIRELVERTRFSLEGGHAAGSAPDRARRDRDHLRERSAGARCDPRRAARRALGPERSLGDRLRRLGLHELHRPAADDRAPADRGDRPRGGRDARRPDRGLGRSRPTSSSSSRRSSRAARPRTRPAESGLRPGSCALARRRLRCRTCVDDAKYARFSFELLQSVVGCVMLVARDAGPNATATALTRAEPEAVATRPRATARGGATRSSTRSTSAASPTRTATASATSPASAPGCRTCATSASTRSGSTRGTRRRSPTPATTSRTTARSTRPSGRSRRPSS